MESDEMKQSASIQTEQSNPVGKREKYDKKRAERDFMLAIYMPKTWKQPLLGVALRELCKALLERQASLGRGRMKLKTLIVELTERVRSGS